MASISVHCPLCSANALPPALEIEGVPAHTVVLYHTSQSALASPTGRMALTACGECGFVFNAAFDEGLLHYVDNYEATQSFSKTFNRFHQALADEVTGVASSRAGVVLEIGCGQGEFLALLEKAGCDGGIGFDPAFDRDRSALPEGSSAKVHPQTFGSASALPAISVIVCKMTLEHIADPVKLLLEIAAVSRKNDACPVFIMVPDAADVFARRAFWDIYYEHCNYFTQSSLGHAMALAGIQGSDARSVYEGQYLLMSGHACGDVSHTVVSEAAVDAELKRFQHFCRAVADLKDEWRQRLQKWQAADERVVLWGGGSKAVGFLALLGAGEPIVGLFDINPRKRDTFLPVSAQQVVLPSDFRRFSPTRIVLMNAAYEKEVAHMCQEIGLDAPIESVDWQ